MRFLLAQSDLPTARELAFWIIATFIAIGIIWRTGAFRGASVIGPEHVGRVHTRPLAILMLAGFMLSMLIAQGFLAFQQVKQQNAGQKAFDPGLLTPGDWAFLSVVPGVAGIILIVVGHLAGKTGAVKELGFAPSQFMRGMLGGILGLIVVLPIMAWWMIFLQWFYDVIKLQHPNEHDLLRQLRNASSPGAKAAIIIGATIVAPVFEELVFRGHLQTLLVRFFTRGWNASIREGSSDPLPLEDPSSRCLSPWPYWSAIVLSSLLFAMIHTPWMAPAIFVLSLCLGYLYQRTGNLWVTIVLHSLFNIFNTITFLAQANGH